MWAPPKPSPVSITESHRGTNGGSAKTPGVLHFFGGCEGQDSKHVKDVNQRPGAGDGGPASTPDGMSQDSNLCCGRGPISDVLPPEISCDCGLVHLQNSPSCPVPPCLEHLPPCVTFRLVVAPLRGPGRSPVLPFACCVRLLLSVGRCGRCSCWCRFRVRGAQ